LVTERQFLLKPHCSSSVNICIAFDLSTTAISLDSTELKQVQDCVVTSLLFSPRRQLVSVRTRGLPDTDGRSGAGGGDTAVRADRRRGKLCQQRRWAHRLVLVLLGRTGRRAKPARPVAATSRCRLGLARRRSPSRFRSSFAAGDWPGLEKTRFQKNRKEETARPDLVTTLCTRQNKKKWQHSTGFSIP